MYCHLCKIEATSHHDRSLGHRAAKELVAAALDRLSNQLTKDSAEGSINASTEPDSDKVKTPEAVMFCDSCNVVYPINEQAAHLRLKKHALALLNEELKMYCHLCKIEATSHHDRSLGHRAAKELVAAALDRLSNQLTKDSAEGSINASTEPDSDKVKTPEAVMFCDSCNVVYPFNEQAAHLRLKKHALALLNEEIFEELVLAYVGETTVGSPSEASDDGAFVDETETEKTYTCDYCALEVPNVFKPDHERGTLHRTNHTIALAAARRARDMLVGATPEDRPEDKPKFTGKMMRKLLRMYTGKSKDVEQTDAEPEPREKERTRLTAKGYFTDIMPFLPYVGSFNTLYIDNTEYVTINVGSDYLKIHVNNLNGLNNVDGKDYLCCRLCDGFNNMYYGSSGDQDKLHVMSLGHIRNVLAPVDNVHLIRKIGDTHAICALCNVHMSAHMIENHVLKDHRHSTNLSEALERGKDFKENRDHLKIVCYQPNQKPSIFKHTNNQWRFGIPQQPSYFGGPFGATASGNTQTGFGSQGPLHGNTQSIFGTFGSAQPAGSDQPIKNNISVSRRDTFGNASAQTFGSQNASSGLFGVINNTALNDSTCFGAPQNQATGFGAPQNQATGFGAPQNHAPGFGAPLKNVSIFDLPHNNATGPTISLFSGAQNKAIAVDVSQNNANGFGAPQKNVSIFDPPLNNATRRPTISLFSGAQNKAVAVDASQNNANSFGAPQKIASTFGAPQNNATGIGAPQNNSTCFGAPQNNATGFIAPQNNATGFGAPQNNATGFGAPQNNATGFGAPPNNATGFGAPQNNGTGFGAPQNKATGFGAPPNNATGFGAPQNNATGFGAPPNNATGVGAPPSNATPFGAPQNNATPFGASENTESGFGAQNISPGGFNQKNTTSFGGAPNKTSATELRLGYGLRNNASSDTPQSKDTDSGVDQTKTSTGEKSVLKIKDEVIDKSDNRKRTKTHPKSYYSSSSSDDE